MIAQSKSLLSRTAILLKRQETCFTLYVALQIDQQDKVGGILVNYISIYVEIVSIIIKKGQKTVDR